MDASNLEPRGMFVASVRKSLGDLVFTFAWALATVFLLAPLSWWIAAASFVILAITSLADAVRLVGLVVALPAVIHTSAAAGGKHFYGLAILVQVIESVIGFFLCMFVYRMLWALRVQA